MVLEGTGWVQPPPRARPHPTQGLTHFHAIGLHLPLILLVHGPHVAVKEARGIGDRVASSAGGRWAMMSDTQAPQGGATSRARGCELGQGCHH